MTLSYQMPLGNVQSYDASGRKVDLLKPSECHHMRCGIWPNHYITFIVAEKA